MLVGAMLPNPLDIISNPLTFPNLALICGMHGLHQSGHGADGHVGNHDVPVLANPLGELLEMLLKIPHPARVELGHMARAPQMLLQLGIDHGALAPLANHQSMRCTILEYLTGQLLANAPTFLAGGLHLVEWEDK
jgi:hypothetical protein